jgi:UDP-N-acetylglucosamine 4,6-dehydratase/5-epimerase
MQRKEGDFQMGKPVTPRSPKARTPKEVENMKRRGVLGLNMNRDMLHGKVILLTGGTGSFGQKFTEIILAEHPQTVIRIFSRDELKQWDMARKFANSRRIRFFIGDVRDKERLSRAMDGVDIVVHAAALKQVGACEYNPFEAVKTNVVAAQNIIEAAIDHNVYRVCALSTDKAVNPVNLYGATKMCMERLFVAANSYMGASRRTRLSCVRYGNVVGSRGSVVPLFAEEIKAARREKRKPVLTVTDERMTRFWITLEQGVRFVIACMTERTEGGETFVPKIPSMRVTDLAKAMAKDARLEFIGIRPGEKIHECLLTEDEARHSADLGEFFVVEPEVHGWQKKDWRNEPGAVLLREGFRYTSDVNESWLTIDDLKKMAKA